jgi:hypothetical protein
MSFDPSQTAETLFDSFSYTGQDRHSLLLVGTAPMFRLGASGSCPGISGPIDAETDVLHPPVGFNTSAYEQFQFTFSDLPGTYHQTYGVGEHEFTGGGYHRLVDRHDDGNGRQVADLTMRLFIAHAPREPRQRSCVVQKSSARPVAGLVLVTQQKDRTARKAGANRKLVTHPSSHVDRFRVRGTSPVTVIVRFVGVPPSSSFTIARTVRARA